MVCVPPGIGGRNGKTASGSQKISIWILNGIRDPNLGGIKSHRRGSFLALPCCDHRGSSSYGQWIGFLWFRGLRDIELQSFEVALLADWSSRDHRFSKATTFATLWLSAGQF